MSYAERHTVAITTSTAGAATEYTTALVTGRIVAIRWAPTAYAAGATITVSTDVGAQTVLAMSATAAFTKYPRVAANTTTGGSALFATGGTNILDYAVAASERVKAVVANGGDTKSGTLTVVVA